MSHQKESTIYRCVNNSYLCWECAQKKLDQFKVLGSGPYFNGRPLICSSCGTKLHSIKGDTDAVGSSSGD